MENAVVDKWVYNFIDLDLARHVVDGDPVSIDLFHRLDLDYVVVRPTESPSLGWWLLTLRWQPAPKHLGGGSIVFGRVCRRDLIARLSGDALLSTA